MESWQLDFEWLRIRHFVKESLGSSSLPDLQGILFMIGVQEFGNWIQKKQFSKEEKQDLMHVAVCTLLEPDGYYKFIGRDQDGWPHWEMIKPFEIKGSKDQEFILKQKIIQYFSD
ncbi:MAG TPA: hypothetical protein PKC30_09220 [Saprospiraceae bacterium]|nr:hypothetical protein [Saprospiraceae bacterium]